MTGKSILEEEDRDARQVETVETLEDGNRRGAGGD